MPLRFPAAGSFGTSLVFMLVLGALAMPAQASFPPKKMHISREKVAETCNALGVSGRGIGLDAASGKYGCENLAERLNLALRGIGRVQILLLRSAVQVVQEGPGQSEPDHRHSDSSSGLSSS